MLEKVKMLDIEDSMLGNLKSADYDGFVKVGMEYADTVIKADEDFSDNMNALFTEFKLTKTINEIEPNENQLDSYFNLYNELAN